MARFAAVVVAAAAVVGCDAGQLGRGLQGGDLISVELAVVQGLSNAQANAVRVAFDEAAEVWNKLIVNTLPDVTLRQTLTNNDLGCGNDLQFVRQAGEVVRGIEIVAQVAPIDGRGQILGQAGPCGARSTVGAARLPRFGRMTFDADDVAGLLNAGTFNSVVLHEMGHVIGIGPLWGSSPNGDLVSGRGGSNPTYRGANGNEGFAQVSGKNGNAPVENVGGGGTRDAHWRTSSFGNEVMTGFLSGREQPLSLMTAKSLIDIGYEVNLDSDVIDTGFAVDGSTFPDLPNADDVFWDGDDIGEWNTGASPASLAASSFLLVASIVVAIF
mmetsp:Transcript_14888/g.27535  ORF Transcript_14888/g.27535 Transcript_14888/m.27535 type:complete len:327 (+) Transcript_14888:25-1005(+)